MTNLRQHVLTPHSKQDCQAIHLFLTETAIACSNCNRKWELEEDQRPFLPVMPLNGKHYFVDRRLAQIRNVEDWTASISIN